MYWFNKEKSYILGPNPLPLPGSMALSLLCKTVMLRKKKLVAAKILSPVTKTKSLIPILLLPRFGHKLLFLVPSHFAGHVWGYVFQDLKLTNLNKEKKIGYYCFEQCRLIKDKPWFIFFSK